MCACNGLARRLCKEMLLDRVCLVLQPHSFALMLCQSGRCCLSVVPGLSGCCHRWPRMHRHTSQPQT